MTRGRILIAHNSKAVRSIMRRRTLAEAPDFLIDEVESADEFAKRVRDGAFDVVICDEAITGSQNYDWITDLLRPGAFSNIGYVFLVSEATTGERRKRLAQFGAHAFIDAKCTGSDIASAIDEVFDPRNHRQFRRVSIPGTQAKIRVGETDIGADVVNLSVAGMLCEFTCPAQFGVIVLLADISIRFPADLEATVVDGIRGRVLRIHVATRGAEHQPERVRAAWQFIHVPNDSVSQLDAVLALADDEAPPESRSLMAE